MIDQQFIYNILNNDDKMDLEYEYAYQYGVFEKIDEIQKPAQEYGNCGWESHRDAVEGIIYIELLNRQVEPNTAKELSKLIFKNGMIFMGIS